MDPLVYIQNAISLALKKKDVVRDELEVVAQNLVPSVLQIFLHDHKETLFAIQKDIATLSDAEAFEHPQIKHALEMSIKKVCDLYTNEFVDISSVINAHNVITNDLAVLLKSAPTTWETIKEKTYQELLNDATPGSNDERVFLWIGEIKKGTGIAPEINETIHAYSKRAIISFLKSQQKNTR